MGKIIDLTEKTFGRLTVLGEGVKPETRKSKEKFWLCECICGNRITTSGYQLRSGKTQSCGCLAKERISELAKTGTARKHGMYNTRIYKNYHGMKARCYNSKHAKYSIYGARGISICDEWLGDDGFVNFYNWAMANGYDDDKTIDRVDVDGDYSPANCRWADASLQGYNRHVQSNNSTGHRGISKLKNGRFRAYIKKDNKQISLGWYDKIEDAIVARQNAEKELFNELPNKEETDD